jgi:Tfp pilus assembly protein PilN
MNERMAKEEKEREIARLRELQEKANDRQADIDALREKRSFE